MVGSTQGSQEAAPTDHCQCRLGGARVSLLLNRSRSLANCETSWVLTIFNKFISHPPPPKIRWAKPDMSAVCIQPAACQLTTRTCTTNVLISTKYHHSTNPEQICPAMTQEKRWVRLHQARRRLGDHIVQWGAEAFREAILPRSFQVISKAINKYVVSTDSGQFAVKNTNTYKGLFPVLQESVSQ